MQRARRLCPQRSEFAVGVAGPQRAGIGSPRAGEDHEGIASARLTGIQEEQTGGRFGTTVAFDFISGDS